MAGTSDSLASVEAIRQRLGRIAPRKLEILVGLAAPAAFAFLLLAGEAMLRFEQWSVFGTNQAFETKIQKKIWEIKGGRRRPRPGTEFGRVRFNEQGVRGNFLPIPKPEGLARIGFFGSSTTAEIHIGDVSQTWSAIAMARLVSTYAHCKLDYFNAGVPGYSVDAVRDRLAGETAPLEPDIAVFMINDTTRRGREQLAARGIETAGYKPGWLAERSLLWLKLEKNVTAQRLKRIALRQDIANRLDLAQLEGDLFRDLEALVQTAMAQNALPVLVENAPISRRAHSLVTQAEYSVNRLLYLPGVFIADVTESNYRYNATMGDVAKSTGVPLIRTLEKMQDNKAFYLDATHTTPRGNERLGGIIGEALSANLAVKEVLNKRGAGCAG